MTYLLLAGGALIVIMLSSLVAIGLGVIVVFSSGHILPGVAAAGVPLGGLTVQDATARLAANLTDITIRDGARTWRIPASQVGLTFDAAATADAARRYGRENGSLLSAMIGSAEVAPVIKVDAVAAVKGVEALASMVNQPARNATIRMENGQLVPVAAEPGRTLLTAETAALLVDAAAEMKDGALDLDMKTTYPTITDASPLLAQTRALLASPLTINGYNPITNQSQPWAVPVDTWGRWLTTENSTSGIKLSLDGGPLTDFLNQRSAEIGPDHYLNVGEGVKTVQAAIAAGTANATVRVYNRPTRYTVQSGDTLGTISWKVGIQMFRISKANPGINTDALAPGQVITIPSKDDLLPLPVVPDKRIVISISRQRMQVYEHGQVKWNWIASTGIPDSPTMPGIYQVQSHDGTAYAGNWNLYMPYFMSIYEAVPGFFNGIHGFPSRGGAQILWEGSLGREVTYGCILLSTTNAKLLYAWAEDGVVTEIQP